MSNRMDPEQARLNVGPDLDPYCLVCTCYRQKTKVIISSVRAYKPLHFFLFFNHGTIVVVNDTLSAYRRHLTRTKRIIFL